ncbi:MAG: hypothetical protein ABII12_17250 [Planctomycetota bacterium]
MNPRSRAPARAAGRQDRLVAARRRRSAIEPKIGHLKSDNRVRRCFLSGLEGDAINIILAVACATLRKLLARLYFALFRDPAQWPEWPPQPCPILFAAA